MSALNLPDREARVLWDRVDQAVNRLPAIVDGIARLTVAGEQTRAELTQAAVHLEQAETILKRVSASEYPLFDERIAAMGIDIEGPVTEAWE
jgi:hypothetical protein